MDRFLARGIAINVLIYMPVGVFGFLALRQHIRTAFAVAVTLLFALALSSDIEMTTIVRRCSRMHRF